MVVCNLCRTFLTTQAVAHCTIATNDSTFSLSMTVNFSVFAAELSFVLMLYFYSYNHPSLFVPKVALTKS